MRKPSPISVRFGKSEFLKISGASNSWTNRFIATYSYQEALEEDGVTESLPNI
jgi:hypothetical protein